MLEKLAYNSFQAYIKMMMPTYEFNWHHVAIIRALEDFAFDDTEFLFIEAPPRHGKSLITSVFFPAWYMGHHPNHEVVIATYSQDLASKFGRSVRNNVDHKYFRSIFGFGLSKDSKGKVEFANQIGGEMHAVGVGSGLTGKGCNLGICDDTLKGRAEADSKRVRESLHEWFESTLMTRRAKKSKMIFMQTRWHKEDLIGYVQKNYPETKSKIIKLPIVNKKETETLWPSFMNLEKALYLKEKMTPKNWASIYMQSPMAAEGNIFTKASFRYYKNAPKKFDSKIISADFTFKDTKGADYVVIQLWGKLGKNVFLLDQIRGIWGFTKSVSNMSAFVDKHGLRNIDKIVIEDKANGPAIIDVLKGKWGDNYIEPINPQSSKVERANAVQMWWETGNVYFPDASLANWLYDYESELLEFDSGAHDDQVDATTQAVSYMLGTENDYLEKLLGKK
jgi:predicted phage terminase large subunit-like protein